MGKGQLPSLMLKACEVQEQVKPSLKPPVKVMAVPDISKTFSKKISKKLQNFQTLGYLIYTEGY
jgi:hypothetical protein